MNYTEKHLDQIDDELSRPTRNGDPPKFSQSVSTDPELKAAAEDVELLWQATRLERLQGKLEMLKEFALRQAQGTEAKAKAEAKEDKKINVVSIRRMRWIMSAAAGILLLVTVGWFLFRDQGPQEIKNEYLAMHFEEYIRHDVIKGDGIKSQFTREQLRAYDMYAIPNFDKAIPLLEEMWKVNNDQLSLFYLIVIRIGIGEVSSGELLFEENKDSLTQQQISLIDELITQSQ